MLRLAEPRAANEACNEKALESLKQDQKKRN